MFAFCFRWEHYPQFVSCISILWRFLSSETETEAHDARAQIQIYTRCKYSKKKDSDRRLSACLASTHCCPATFRWHSCFALYFSLAPAEGFFPFSMPSCRSQSSPFNLTSNNICALLSLWRKNRVLHYHMSTAPCAIIEAGGILVYNKVSKSFKWQAWNSQAYALDVLCFCGFAALINEVFLLLHVRHMLKTWRNSWCRHLKMSGGRWLIVGGKKHQNHCCWQHFSFKQGFFFFFFFPVPLW